MNETRTPLQRQLAEYVAAGFAGLWITTAEAAEAQREIFALCNHEGWNAAGWDCDRGLYAPTGVLSSDTDPLAAVRAAVQVSDGQTPGILCLHNFHRFIDSSDIMQATYNALQVGKERHSHLVILSPTVKIPAELERVITVVEHQLPDRAALAEIGRSIATEPGEYPEEETDEQQVIDAAAGLTRSEAENAFSLSVIRHARLTPPALWELKTDSLKKSGLLSLHRGQENFADLGGLEGLKDTCLRLLAAGETAAGPARGVMLLGVPGSGKSQFAKALGHETGRPTLIFDVGGLFASHVGETEGNIRRALQIADAMAPCILFIDEVEKALAGSDGPSGDSGVAQRLFGTLLSWLSDHTSDVFTICTANDVSKLRPEFGRNERFDSMFFLDLPDRVQRAGIWQLYRERFAIDADEAQVEDEGWTGAEIKSCCRLACKLRKTLAEAARLIVPVSRSAGEKIAALRQWAAERCVDANSGLPYSPNQNAAKPTAARAIVRPGVKPSSN